MGRIKLLPNLHFNPVGQFETWVFNPKFSRSSFSEIIALQLAQCKLP